MFVPQTFTLHVQLVDGKKGVWLCLDNGFETIPIAKFVSEQAAERYKQAVSVAFAKAHTMGAMGI